MITGRIRLASGCLLTSIVLSLGSLWSTTKEGPLDFRHLYAAGVAMQHGWDPYSPAVICQIEIFDTGATDCFPYSNLPPFTALMLPIGLLSFDVAASLWVAVMMACAFALGYLALFLARLPVRGSIIACVVVAGILVFYPVKHDLALGQSDDLSASLALAAIALGTISPIPSGALSILALLVKPQAVALSMATLLVKRLRLLFGVLLAGVATAIALLLLTKIGHSPGTLFDWYQAVRGRRTTPSGALVTLQLLLAVAAGGWILAHWRRKHVDVVVLCGVAAAFNVILGSLIYLQTDSVTLLILPLLLVL